MDQQLRPTRTYRCGVNHWIFLLMLLAGNAPAQPTAPAQEVLAVAPQLEAFAGSKANFESLASGLRAGKTVRLVTITPDGMREIVSFTAAKALSAGDTARVLENARYNLLDRGLGAPSGWDIALVLMGHMDITPSGPVHQPGTCLASSLRQRSRDRRAARGRGPRARHEMQRGGVLIP
jgi:hypothetical protein